MKVKKGIDKPKSELDQLLLNIGCVYHLLMVKDRCLLKKIHEYSQRYGIDINHIYERIMEKDFITMERFATQPKRQGRSEQVVSYALDNADFVYDFEQLPKFGNGSLYFSNGVITSNRDNLTHSLDYVVHCSNFVAYMSAKQINQAGGSQKQQYNELRYYAKSTNDYHTNSRRFGAIIEGAYFTDKKISALLSDSSNFLIWRIEDDYTITRIN